MTKASLELIIKALNDAGVRYMVVGGIAVNAHGYVRFTVDVDLMIQLEPQNLLKGLRALETLGYKPAIPATFEEIANAAQREAWIVEKQIKALKLFSDLHRETSIDVFVDDPLGFDKAFDRRDSFVLTDNLEAPVCSYLDLVKLKLLASRPKDLIDLEQLKKARGET